MLFNSYEFIIFFLPVTLLGFYLLSKTGQYTGVIIWLILTSLFFYGWWNPPYLILIIISILVNYTLGEMLSNNEDSPKILAKKSILVTGTLINLSLIGYYKYANFFIENVNNIANTNYHLETIILPLAISFFTFQQIAYLVDSYQGKVRHSGFMHYILFVTFFPQLIAGPIVHHKEVLPQFTDRKILCFKASNLSIGLTIFMIGLFKKVIIADSMALYATPVFDAAGQGVTLSVVEAWCGTLAYSFQLYFDFSGYSDMAIGAARLFGIKIPLNFNSPYKSYNIVQFWRNWHITLSQFLKYYVYIPLGGNKKGVTRRYTNLILTMLIGGLWHGAGWTFVIWGGIHGAYLTINHLWIELKKRFMPERKSTFMSMFAARLTTFIAVAISWVFFRADSFNSAISILQSMFGLNGFDMQSLHSSSNYYEGLPEVAILSSVLFICWYFPNTQQIMKNYNPAYKASKHPDFMPEKPVFNWRPSPAWALISGFVIVMGVFSLYNESEFLYFQF